jgi:hypothetical protein
VTIARQRRVASTSASLSGLARPSVFIDIEAIEAGENFAEVIEQKVGFCDALVAVIGMRWLTSTDPGGLS